MKPRKIIILGLFLVLGLSITVSNVFAQEAIRFQPAIIGDGAGQVIEPGKTFESSIRATNISQSPVTYDVIVEDIKDQVDGKPVFADPGEETATGIKNWVTFKDKKITIGPNETEEIFFSIAVPKDAFPGSHFGSIMLSRPGSKPGTSGSGIGFQAGPVIVIRIPGNVSENARLREFSKDKGIYSSPEVSFGVKIENLGNVLVRPRGPLEIYNMRGQKVSETIINDEFSSIFPGKERSFDVAWKGEGFYFGRYDAIASVGYGFEGSKTITGAVSFWILPLNLILPVFFGVLFLVLVIVFGLKMYIRKRIKELAPGSVRTTNREGMPFGRLMFMTLATIAFTVILLGILFLLFS